MIYYSSMRFYPRSQLAAFGEDQFFDLSQELSKINKDDIFSELSKHPSVYSYYHGLLVTQKGRVDKLNNNYNTLFATLRKDKYESGKNGGAKFTATYLDDFALSNPDCQELKNRILDEELIYSFLKALCSMLEHKKDMLVQMSANLRSESKLYNT